MSDSINAFRAAREPRELEELADRLRLIARSADDNERIDIAKALLERLPGDYVQDDDDVLDAVCGALTEIGVMDCLGNLRFRFRPIQELSDQLASHIQEIQYLLPRRHFGK